MQQFFAYMTLQYTHNIPTLSENIKCICINLETEQKNLPDARISTCF